MKCRFIWIPMLFKQGMAPENKCKRYHNLESFTLKLIIFFLFALPLCVYAQKPTGAWQFSSAHFKANNVAGTLETREFVSVDQLAIANQYNNQLFNIPIAIQFGPELFISDDALDLPVMEGFGIQTHSATRSMVYRIEGNQIVTYAQRTSNTEWQPEQAFTYRTNGKYLEIDYLMASDATPTIANCVFTCTYIKAQ